MSKIIKHNGPDCLDDTCFYRKSCANHVSAGDYRMEGGFTPQLWYKKILWDKSEGDLICESCDFESNGEYHPAPKNREHLRGYLGNIPDEFKMDQTKYLEARGSEKVKKQLHDFLNECLESYNQSHSFEIKAIDLEKGKLTVEFNIVVVPEDNYIGFQGY